MIDSDLKETADSFLEKDLPEAPVSITVRGYYKGFSVLITKRNATGEVELEKIMQAIDNMVTRGFKPSWIEETNNKHTSITQSPVLPAPLCPNCQIPMVRRTVKKTGHPFWGCPNFPNCQETIWPKE